MFVSAPPTSAACARPRGAGEGSGSVSGRRGRSPGQSVVRALVPCYGGLQRAATGCSVRGHQPEFLQTVQGNCCSYRNCVKTDYLADKLLPSS
ncbi:COMM domain-containing protein 6 isoform X2 [Meles meles]|uniref:COMM domain-containing protein 6 isoform X2 n=1 Tax=Meles meles TaxID=9662 RepID=UPI001E69AAC5|nr:COMM domain-containing protein 6 isoform X2 [Meles meles]